MNFRSITSVGATALLSLSLGAQDHGKPVDASASNKTIVEIAVEAGQFQTLVAAVKAAGLAETLSGKGPFTVFAPTDAAFAKLGKDTIAELLKPDNKAKLTAILTYHVLGADTRAAGVVAADKLATLQGCSLAVELQRTDGKVTGVKVGGANVVKTDIVGNNGVIHVIDSVMLPPGNLVEVAAKAASFNTLLAAAKAAGLADTLAEGGPFTIFAPTDAAFRALGDDAIQGLLKPENKAQLVAILKRHVVAGKVMAAQAVKLDSATTLNGASLPLMVKAGKLHVGNATVTTADVEARNGVIHVIDAVLLPKE